MRRPLRLPCFDRCSLCPNASQRTLWRLSHSPSLPLFSLPPFPPFSYSLSLPRLWSSSMHGFTQGVVHTVQLLIMLHTVSYLHKYLLTHIHSFIFSLNFYNPIFCPIIYVQNTCELLPMSPGPDAVGQVFLLSSYRAPWRWGFEVGGGGWMQCQEKVCHNVATRISYLDTMRPVLMWTPCWLTGHTVTSVGCNAKYMAVHCTTPEWNSLINSARWRAHLMRKLQFKPTVTRGR